MAAQKRRKSGLTSFVTDAVHEHQKANLAAQKLEQRAFKDRAKEAAKAKTVADREKATQAREAEIAAGHAEAEAATRTLQARLTELETLLVSTLEEDPYLAFEQLKEPMLLPEFHPPPELAVPGRQPEENDFLPEPPSGLSALAPGRKRAHAAAVEEGRAAYAQALTQYGQTERARQEQCRRSSESPHLRSLNLPS